MKSVSATTEQTFRDSGSRFLGLLFPASSVEAFQRRLEDLQKEHPTASHHCFAWRLNPSDPLEKSQDDGEPPGTAGPPILNELRSASLINCGCIVVRYFGGTKLGRAGLIEAYGHTTRLCIDSADIRSLRKTRRYRIEYDYPLQNRVESWISRYGLVEESAEYLERVTLNVACPARTASRFERELDESGHRLHELEKLGEEWRSG